MALTFEEFKQLRSQGLSPEQIVAFEDGKTPENMGESPENKAFLPGQNRVKDLISKRKDSMQTLKEELDYNPKGNLLHAIMKQPTLGMKALAVPAQRLEAAVAAPALKAQASEGGKLQAMWEGLSGQNQSQLGDLVRTTGIGSRFATPEMKLQAFGKTLNIPSVSANDLMAGAAGFGGAAGVLGGASKLAMATMPKIKIVGNFPDKVFRGGVQKGESIRLQSEYGTSNAGLVDVVKAKLNDKITLADRFYGKVMQNAPEGKQINVRPAIEESGKRLKKLGLITKDGNLTELGNSEIARDSVYGKLLDFYKSADAISGVEHIVTKPNLTPGQMIRWSKSSKQTLVNKDQYTFLRDKLNSLYKNKPSDVDVSKVVNQFYADGENSGLAGLQQARKLTREAFANEEKFLNSKTGDLKLTEAKLSRVGLKSKTGQPAMSKQELDHIAELEKYIGHPITKDATSINKLNQAYERMRKIKERAAWGGAGAVTGGLTTKYLFKH